MEEKLVIKLREQELIEKVNKLRDLGLNIAELLREFLLEYNNI